MSQVRSALSPFAAALLGLAACGDVEQAPETQPGTAGPTDPGMAGEAAATTGTPPPADEAATAGNATSPDAPAAASTRWDRGGGEPVRDGVPPEAVPTDLPGSADVPPEVVRDEPDTGATPPARPTNEPM